MSGDGGAVGSILKVILSRQVVRKPALALEALRVAWAFRVRRGLVPSRAMLNWRLATAYGLPRQAEPEDLIRFLAWRRSVRIAS